MMNRIAKATNIHGIREAWRANRIGRIFYAAVFTISFVFMFLQLKDLFQSYISESVGTRLTGPSAVDHTELPSFYYCNDMWFPNLLGVTELARDGLPRSITKAKISLHVKTLRRNDTVYPIDTFWRLMGIQDLINGIMMLPEKERYDKLHRGVLMPDEGSDAFYARSHREISEMSNNLLGRSLQMEVVNNLGGSPARSKINHTHGIFPHELHVSRIISSLDQAYDEVTLIKSNRSGKPRLNLDGICWELPPGTGRQKQKQARARKHKHVVTHFGGLGAQFAKLVHLYLTTPGRKEMPSVATFRQAVYVAVREVVQYATLFRHIYATYVSIAPQAEPHLLFDQKIRIDHYAPSVLIKYWTIRSVLKSRKGWPCRSEWTALDQAHCNQRHTKEKGDLFCEQYLPASNHFDETEITKKTCVHDHTGLFELVKSAAGKQTLGQRAAFPFPINSANRQRMLLNLTTNSEHCPEPCSKTLFRFETTYPTTDINQKLFQCRGALSTIFVPSEDTHVVWWGNQPLQVKTRFSQKHFKAYVYLWAMHIIALLKNNDGTKLEEWPCSVIEYEWSEESGQISEEYFLHSVSDLAANVGGTVGLWFGASVLSIVQIFYLCCLKKLFKRFMRHRLIRRMTRCLKCPAKGGRIQNLEHGQRVSNKPRIRPTVSMNRVHHI